MANGTQLVDYSNLDNVREDKFNHVWHDELNDVFAEVAKYYDRANHVASLGLWNWFRKNFISLIDVQPGHQVLDVCAGTNAIGIALLKKQANARVTAIDRSEAMQKMGALIRRRTIRRMIAWKAIQAAQIARN